MAVTGFFAKTAAAGFVLVAASLFASLVSSASAQTKQKQFAWQFGIGAWSEVVVSVTDLEASSRWLVEDGGWHVTARGKMHRDELDYYKLPQSVSGQFLKICAPGAKTGCIRYVQFIGAKNQRPIRLAARPWDTGGIFSIMLRSNDTQAMFDAAIKRGWWAESPPYAFSFGGSDLLNVVISGPHGVNYALYERKSPLFTGFRVGKLSQAFNTMRMVKDQPASLAWYRDRLGLLTLFDAPFTDPEPRPNNFSVPANLATTLARRAAVVQPFTTSEDGRIELMQFEGFKGRDYSAHASPPNLGIISVRYPVQEITAYSAHLYSKGIPSEYALEDASVIEALSEDSEVASMFAVRDPDGNLTEFYDVE